MQYNDKDEVMCLGGCPYFHREDTVCKWKIGGNACPTKPPSDKCK
jgi:hypothetical protein